MPDQSDARRSSVLRSSSTLTTTVTDENDPFGVEAHADQLLHLLNGNVDPNLDFSGTGTSKTLGQIQTASTTVDTISPDFDLYEESCIDAATRSSEQCLSTIAELGTELRTYLLDQFWERFNACIPVLHKTVFLGSLQPFEGQGQGSYGPFCSPELHLAVLAMGLRRANHTRPEVARLLRSGWDSTLHQQLRGAVDVLLQLRKEWKTVDVQAVVILAHLESERGRDHSARVYLGKGSEKLFSKDECLPYYPIC